MDKRTFLTELERALRILKEEELLDIISEYEQHIDTKVAAGLTEEAAIADFGSLEELKAEILEAYHVRADYDVEKPGRIEAKDLGKRISDEKHIEFMSDTGRRNCFQQIRSMGSSLGKKLKKIGIWCKDAVRKAASGGKGILQGLKTKTVQCKKQTNAVSGKKQTGRIFDRIKQVIKGTWNVMAVLFCWMLGVFWWCMKLCWNLWWIGVSFVLGSLAVISLFCVGVLAVLWIQGYPLAGATVGFLGMVLGFGSAAGMGCTFLCRLWRKKTMVPETAVKPEVSGNA